MVADGTFESGVSGWTPNSATFVQSSVQKRSGGFSGLLTVTGTPTQAYVRTDNYPVTPGNSYTATGWLYSVAGYANCGFAIDWYNSTGGYISTSSGTSSSLPAATWKSYLVTGTAPANAAFGQYGPTIGGNPPAGTAVYVDDVTVATIFLINALTRHQSSAFGMLKPAGIYTLPVAGSTDQVWVEILDRNLVSQGIVQFVNISAQLYYNAVGSWTITVPYTDALWNIMMAGDFFVNVNWRGLFTFGGKCENPGYQDSIPGAAGGGATGSGRYITLAGADWLGLIANRICYPSPGAAWSAQTAAATDPVSATPLETAIKHYVTNNIGSGAISSRRNTSLNVAASAGRGANVTYTVKFGSGVDLSLLNIIRALITSTGNGNAMGVQITRNPSTHNLTFDVYIPRDLTGKAWFSEQLGNVVAINFNVIDPTCTDSLVQGSGTSFIQATAAGRTIWNAVEVYSDSASETVVTNLQTTANEALLSGQAGPTIGVTATDIPLLTFGRDYWVGDKVSVEVRPGVVYSDIVTGVTLTADPSQNPEISVVPTIGQNANSTSTDQSITGQLTARIRALEKQMAKK